MELDENAPSAGDVSDALGKLEKFLVRDHILSGNPRIDRRDVTTVRPITVKTGILLRTHGSALFTRGETQALVVTTLCTTRDAQIIDAVTGEYKDPFMLHYNFPKFCVGETDFEGKVIKILNFGAFVSLAPGRDGLVHIPQLSDERVENVTDVVKEGEMVKVKALEVDKQGRVRLSMKVVGKDD